ncbi:hypothetical protein B0J14DRAFT_655816 [Halenospora varia]|nr:hypothetical protein B0J14DRAFT_655816 [Halenospora varia]
MVYAQEQYNAPEVVPLDHKQVVPIETSGSHKEYAPNVSVSALTTGYVKHRRRIIFVAVIAIVVIIAIILGGVLGTQLHHGSSHPANATSTPKATDSPSRSSSSTPGSNSTALRINVLVNSRLAASNFTDLQGVNHRTVFFQDPWNNILVQQWNSTTSTWSTRNISDEGKSLIPGGLKFAPRSPLATTATDYWDTTLWYLDNNYQVQSVYWTLNDSKLVFHSDVNDARLIANVGSSLAAAWQRPPRDNDTGRGFWGVAFQNMNGDVMFSNNSDFRLLTTVVANADVAMNSSIVLLPDIDPASGRISRLIVMWQSNNVAIKRSSYKNWDHGLDFSVISSLPTLSSGVQFAMTAFKAWTNVLFIALKPNGNLASNWWDGSKFNNLAETKLASGSAVNFSAIAMTSDAMCYGILGDRILEYSVDQSNPATFNYVGIVFG